VELQVRDARLMDIDRIIGLMDSSDSVPGEPAELARWESVGFAESGPQMRLPLVRSAVAIW